MNCDDPLQDPIWTKPRGLGCPMGWDPLDDPIWNKPRGAPAAEPAESIWVKPIGPDAWAAALKADEGE